MTQTVRLSFNIGDATGRLIKNATCFVTPSVEIVSDDDGILIERVPLPVKFTGNGIPALDLFPNDLVGPQQLNGNPGWSYIIYFPPNFPVKLPRKSIWLWSTDGPDQRLSDLVSAPEAQPLIRGGDKNFTMDFSATVELAVEHNLGKKPAINVIDSSGDEVDFGTHHVDSNNVIISFSSLMGGTVTCN